MLKFRQKVYLTYLYYLDSRIFIGSISTICPWWPPIQYPYYDILVGGKNMLTLYHVRVPACLIGHLFSIVHTYSYHDEGWSYILWKYRVFIANKVSTYILIRIKLDVWFLHVSFSIYVRLTYSYIINVSKYLQLSLVGIFLKCAMMLYTQNILPPLKWYDASINILEVSQTDAAFFFDMGNNKLSQVIKKLQMADRRQKPTRARYSRVTVTRAWIVM